MVNANNAWPLKMCRISWCPVPNIRHFPWSSMRHSVLSTRALIRALIRQSLKHTSRRHPSSILSGNILPKRSWSYNGINPHLRNRSLMKRKQPDYLVKQTNQASIEVQLKCNEKVVTEQPGRLKAWIKKNNTIHHRLWWQLARGSWSRNKEEKKCLA